jgi:hypothetical protein
MLRACVLLFLLIISGAAQAFQCDELSSDLRMRWGVLKGFDTYTCVALEGSVELFRVRFTQYPDKSWLSSRRSTRSLAGGVTVTWQVDNVQRFDQQALIRLSDQSKGQTDFCRNCAAETSLSSEANRPESCRQPAIAISGSVARALRRWPLTIVGADRNAAARRAAAALR